MSVKRCVKCERPKNLCECLDKGYRRARVIDLDERTDLCLIGWEEYQFATQVLTHDVDRKRTVENLVPYKEFYEAVNAAIYLNSRRIFEGAEK